MDDFGIEVSPSWTVAIPLERWGVTLRGSYSEGFRAPSFNELFFPDFGNPKLNPEISSEYDGGITKTFGESLSITTTYFSRRVHSLIVAEPCATFPGCVKAANAGRVDTQGVELVPSLRLTRELAFSMTYLLLPWMFSVHEHSQATVTSDRCSRWVTARPNRNSRA